MVDLTAYWVVAQVVSTIFLSLDGTAVAEFHQLRPTVGPGGIPAVTMQETDASGNIADTWFIGTDPLLGAVEYKDTYGDTGKAPTVYASGYFGRWGSASMNVGDSLSYQLHLSSGGGSGAQSWGWQTVTLTALLPTMTVPAGTYENVAQLTWQQYWCADATCSTQTLYAGTYWMAPGIGMIQVNWTSPNPPSGMTLGSAIVTNN